MSLTNGGACDYARPQWRRQERESLISASLASEGTPGTTAASTGERRAHATRDYLSCRAGATSRLGCCDVWVREPCSRLSGAPPWNDGCSTGARITVAGAASVHHLHGGRHAIRDGAGTTAGKRRLLRNRPASQAPRPLGGHAAGA